MRPSRSLSTAVAAVLTVTALAACSKTSTTNNGDADLASQAASTLSCGLNDGKKATGKPIKVGAIATMSNGIDFSSAPLTAKEYFDCVNANGGINGRPIAYDYADDALDPQKASALASKFASDPDVVAMTGGASFVACQGNQPIFAAANLFDILAVGVPKPCFFGANMAPVNAGPRLSLISAAQYLHEHEGVNRVASVGLSVPNLGDWEMPGLQAYADKAGVTVVWTSNVPPPVKDATSLIANLRSKKPEAFVIALPAPDAATVLKAAQQQQLKTSIKFSCQTPCYDTTFPGQIGTYWNGSFYSNSEFTLVDAQTPDNLAWRELLKQYGKADQPRDSFSQAGFLSAKILTDTLLKLDPASIDRATVSKAIQDIKNYKSDLLCGPWYYGPGSHHNANHDLHNVTLDSTGHYVQSASCFATADPELDDIRTMEADPALGLVG